jgi:anti-anti-sigma factor
MPERASPQQVLVAPREPLVAGGPAEDYERRVHDLFRTGCRHLIADMRAVTGIDSAGVRALVRSHTTAQRVGGTFTLVGPQPEVRTVLELSRLASVFTIRESLQEARVSPWRHSNVRLAVLGSALCVALWWAGASWYAPPAGDAGGNPLSPFAQSPAAAPSLWFAREMAKLVAAGLIGLLVTAVQRRFHDKPMTQAMEHAQVLLCVSGALVMMIIGESLARAFGIAGAASIIRFRTPVEDPKDITILFLLMALGMATGIGAFGIAAAGTSFLCVFLFVLEHAGGGRRRTMMVEVGAAGREFPAAHVHRVFARNHIIFEPRELAQKKVEVTMVYHATLDPAVSLEDVSAQLVQGDSGVTSVSWEPPRRNE